MNGILRDPRLGLLWLAARLWVGWQFLHAGWEKTFGAESASWWGSSDGVHGFLTHAISPEQTTGAHPAVPAWYAEVVEHAFLPAERFFAVAIPLGQLLVGAGLVLGLFTAVSAFFGVVMNTSFLLAGSTGAGLNPEMLVLGMLLLAAGPAASVLGADRLVLPRLWAALRRPGRPAARPRRPVPLAR